MENIKIYIDYIAKIMESIGVLAILFGSLFALGKYLLTANKADAMGYLGLRQSLGKAILIGLEILIAADIMSTVVTEPTLKSVSILGLIVIIRTFLSLSLQVEIDGKFPWQKKES